MATPAQYEISQKFFFDSAHTLRREIETDSSLRIHGHTYNARVTLRGEVDARTGMVVDLGMLRLSIDKLRPQLDHRLLDEVAGLGHPTLENLCAFIWRDMAGAFDCVAEVRVWRDSVGDSCTLRATGWMVSL